MARAVKEKFGKPCIAVGNIRHPQIAEEILEKGDADFIGMGRGLIAEPEWVNKVEYGKECDLRSCISCNIGCAGHRIGLNQPIRCTVNPAVNSGEDYMKHKIKKPCNVVVIGGGTAGLEAACTAGDNQRLRFDCSTSTQMLHKIMQVANGSAPGDRQGVDGESPLR